MMLLEEKTNKSEDEIRKIPYPKYKAMLELHSNPKKFLTKIPSAKQNAKSIKEIKRINAELQRKAREQLEKKSN